MDQLEALLQQVDSGNHTAIREAELKIKTLETENFAEYCTALCSLLGDTTKFTNSRMIAVLLLKNTLSSKDPVAQSQIVQRWLALSKESRDKIKELLLQMLCLPERVIRSKIAMSIASIAEIEIPVSQWPNLISVLLANITDRSKSNTKEASLETLGYICESKQLEKRLPDTDQILTALVHGMQNSEADICVRRSACNALHLGISLFSHNFQIDRECQALMSVILDAATCTDNIMRNTAFSILVEVASLHYHVLFPFMNQIFKITLEAIKSGPEDTAKQAIEFWCTLCDEEMALIESMNDFHASQTKCQYYVKGGLQHLVEVITNTLTNQSEDDSDEFTLAMAGGNCLSLIARTVEDDILPVLLPFIENNILSPNWRHREAAILAFGAIMEGCTNVDSYISQAAPVLLMHMKDKIDMVKDTTAWTWGRILQKHHKSVVVHAESILKVLWEALTDKPKIAANASWAIHNFALSFREEAFNPLDKYFNEIVRMLILTGERPDVDEHNLLTSAYETLNVVIANASEESSDSLFNIGVVLVDHLEKSLNSGEDKLEAQGLICGVLQIIVQTIGNQITPIADKLVKCIFRLFRINTTKTTVHEAAFLTIGCTAVVLNDKFAKYMPEFVDILCTGLLTWQDYSVCAVAVGVVGDLARALNTRIAPYCDRIVTLFIQNLQNKLVHRSVKPVVFSCIGDIALAIGGSFERYLDVVMVIIKKASDSVIQTFFNGDNDDIENLEYANAMQESIFEAYTGILHGLRVDSKGDLLAPHVSSMLELVAHVSADPNSTLSRTAVGLCGDIAFTLGKRVKNELQQNFVTSLIRQTMQSGENRETAQWAQQVIARLDD